MNVLVPLPISDVMLTNSTVAEPSAAETVWVSGGTYALGDRRIRTQTHREYECVLAHTGIALAPESDINRWVDVGPTDRWAMFDNTCSTSTSATTSMTVVVAPGFFNAIAFYNLTGANMAVTVKSTPGGTTIYSYSGSLEEPYADWYEWLFAPYRYVKKLVLKDILPYAGAELTVTVTAAAGQPVGIGMICIGDMRSLISGAFGGTQAGAKAEPVDYSYIKTDEYGETRIVKRRNATDMRVSVVLSREDADYALATLQDVLAIPAAWIATNDLNVFGLGSGSLSYDGANHAVFDINVKGLI